MRADARHDHFSVVIDDFDIGRAALRPAKANTPFFVDSDTPLALPVAFQSFQMVAGRGSQVAAFDGRVEHVELSGCGHAKLAPFWRAFVPFEKVLGRAIREAANHAYCNMIRKAYRSIGVIIAA